MDADDEIVSKNLTETEKIICRTYINSKLDIFQNNTEFLFRSLSVVPFKISYERKLMMNEAASILSSSSDFLFYTICGKFKNIHHSKRELNKVFTHPSNVFKSSPQMSSEEITDEFNTIELKIMRNKLKSDPDYLTLCSYISHSHFYENFAINRSMASAIINHPYIRFHPKYKELQELYNASFISNNNK